MGKAKFPRRIVQFLVDLNRRGNVLALVLALPGVVDVVVWLLGKEILIPPPLAFVLFLGAVLIASFRVWDKLKSSDIEAEITGFSFDFGNPVANNLPRNDVFLPEDYHIDVSGTFDIRVGDSDISDAYFRIHSLDTNWPLDTADMSDTKISIEVPKPDYRMENPVTLKDRSTIPSCRFHITIPIRVQVERSRQYALYGAIGAMTRFAVVIAIEIRGKQSVLLPPIYADIRVFHDAVENALTQLAVLQARENTRVTPNALAALRYFWKGQAESQPGDVRATLSRLGFVSRKEAGVRHSARDRGGKR